MKLYVSTGFVGSYRLDYVDLPEMWDDMSDRSREEWLAEHSATVVDVTKEQDYDPGYYSDTPYRAEND